MSAVMTVDSAPGPVAKMQARNLSIQYGIKPAVKGLNLDIAEKEVLALIGPSGCGKSTLLRMIAGLESVTGGSIEIGDKRVNNVHPKDRNIAMVFQNYALYAHMPVKDKMGFSMALATRPQTEIDEQMDWAAQILKLET